MTILHVPPRTPRGPTIFGMPAKQVSLITLIWQNSALILVMHYSRVMPAPGERRYLTSTAVFLSEVIKLAICLCCSIAETSRTLAPSTPISVLFQQIYNAVFSGDGWQLAVPAVLYTIQNTLQYVAIGNLDAVHFQVLSQFKILAAALFSVIILRRTLGPKRWLALFILTLGVSVVSLPQSDSRESYYSNILLPHSSDHFFPRSVHELGHVATETLDRVLGKRSASYQGIEEDEFPSLAATNYSVGLIAAVVSAASSGLAGVYFEKLIKEPTAASPSTAPASIWTRNVQLSVYSLLPAVVIGIFFQDGAEIARRGFFDGYNMTVWAAVILQALGGVVSSLCINYSDNIAKNFAASISIIVSFVFSVLFFDFEFNMMFVLGTSLVMGATYLYSLPDRKSRPAPLRIAAYEKPAIDPAYTPRTAIEPRMMLDPLDAVRPGSMALSTSRPASPMPQHTRAPSARGKRED
ncbi:nucleotide-sugar transporter [Sodiomyces alkalinus F11]|uniref:Nucleotide-sugar transporter n=1 Tax=Sodiomyces alkalinus (strain CBS 110278 / VKM F-3762 / F11) TaxID=1314773 RepID=A0A3N2QAI0_SODAK|nr:nucleotide-sugar transporter [Sodiomyces alkalinus F11]ROT43759.1 nucleotide-sugar transporter [Sodiomyces alkalinus F11]